jgi:hypothetical protein
MIDVLSSTKTVVDNSKEVRVTKEKIHNLVKKVRKEDLQISEIGLAKYSWSLEEIVQIVFLFNTINFCFWAKKGEEKWTVEIDGKTLDGSAALFRCLEKEVKKNFKFLRGDFLADLSEEKLRQILKGNVAIPLFEERLQCLHEAGRVLKSKFDNSFWKIYQAANNDAILMADLLVPNFPKFNDISGWNGKTIAFYKRAQLNSKMISDALVSFGKKPLKNLDKLTAFADYKIPQILRKLGILEYSSQLAKRIDNFELIKPHSLEEVEIRANTVWAVELTKQKLKERFDFVTSSHVDSLLWNMSQEKTGEEKPYHRTLTIAY